jgi:hypothetical protein
MVSIGGTTTSFMIHEDELKMPEQFDAGRQVGAGA